MDNLKMFAIKIETSLSSKEKAAGCNESRPSSSQLWFTPEAGLLPLEGIGLCGCVVKLVWHEVAEFLSFARTDAKKGF